MFFISNLSETVKRFQKRSMIVKLAHFVSEGKTRIGVVKCERIFDLEKSGVRELEDTRTIDDLISQGKLESLSLEDRLYSGQSAPLDSVRLASPILSPQKIYCAAINYLAHSKEQNVNPPSEPYFFTKFGNAIIGPDDPILLNRASKKVDWEV